MMTFGYFLLDIELSFFFLQYKTKWEKSVEGEEEYKKNDKKKREREGGGEEKEGR